MFLVDINCDMGEGTGTDTFIMPWISSVNIACGYHAGDAATMRETAELALQHQVAIGAHPSFPDKETFGRAEMQLPASAIYDQVSEQIHTLAAIVKSAGGALHHVKPHGALYNMSAKEERIAAAIAEAVFDHDPNLILYGLSGSLSLSVADEKGLRTANEVFADRTYQEDGRLTPRTQPGALIKEEEKMLRQVLMMITEGSVISLSGKTVPVKADTICIHGDGEFAAAFAKSIHHRLTKNNIDIRAIS